MDWEGKKGAERQRGGMNLSLGKWQRHFNAVSKSEKKIQKIFSSVLLKNDGSDPQLV